MQKELSIPSAYGRIVVRPEEEISSVSVICYESGNDIAMDLKTYNNNFNEDQFRLIEEGQLVGAMIQTIIFDKSKEQLLQLISAIKMDNWSLNIDSVFQEVSDFLHSSDAALAVVLSFNKNSLLRARLEFEKSAVIKFEDAYLFVSESSMTGFALSEDLNLETVYPSSILPFRKYSLIVSQIRIYTTSLFDLYKTLKALAALTGRSIKEMIYGSFKESGESAGAKIVLTEEMAGKIYDLVMPKLSEYMESKTK